MSTITETVTGTPKENKTADTSVNNENIKDVLNLLKLGDEKFDLRSFHNFVVVLGNTGSDKSTFTQFMAGDNDQLISTEVGENTGEFLITDFNDKISSNSTVISKTTFPELMFDANTKTAYVDCPGFNDNARNDAYDMAAAYFIKKALDAAEKVKIVLIVSYSSLRRGVNRSDFFQLLERITILFKNIEAYVDGIALVAAKVDNSFVKRRGVPILMPDSAIIENIAIFLRKVKQSLITMKNGGKAYASKYKSVESKSFYENAVKLLDILLTKKGDDYLRIGIFRRPDEPGKLSQIQLLQDGKRDITRILQNNLRYLPVDKTNLGYAISDKSKNLIRDLVAEVNNNIIVDIAFIGDNLVTYYRQLEHDYAFGKDIYSLRDIFESASVALARITNVNESVTVADFVNVMSESFTSLGVRVSKSRLRGIANLGKFLLFLQDVGAEKYESSVWKWTKALHHCIQYVSNSRKWYNLLTALYHRLSDYDVQKNRATYRALALRIVPAEGSLVAESKDLVAFLDAVSNADFLKTVNYKKAKLIRLDSTKVEYFNKLVKATFAEPRHQCFNYGQRFAVFGENVLLSDIISDQCYQTSTSVQILADGTVFVDASLKKDSDITIIAPEWQIYGKQTISLDGQDAPPIHPSKARNCGYLGCDGIDGQSGLAGTSAGYFISVGSQFKNMHALTVTANGGNGGRGQDGGDGRDGKNGEDRDGPLHMYCWNWNCSSEINYYSSPFQTVLDAENRAYGDVGGNGGNGGRGGAGGIGGYAGTLITVDTARGTEFSNYTIIAKNGTRGIDGVPGEPGNGGLGGFGHSHLLSYNYWTGFVTSEINRGRSESGKPGKKPHQAVTGNRISPQTKEYQYSPSLIISDYRNELVNNFGNSFKKRVSSQFYQELQRNAKLNEYYDVGILLREFRHVENCHNRSEITGDAALSLYNSILEKILRLAGDNVQLSFNDRELLKYLRLVVTFKLLTLRAESDNSVVPPFQRSFQLKLGIPEQSSSFDESIFVSNWLNVLDEDNIDPVLERIETRMVKLSYGRSHEVADNHDELSELLLKRKLFDGLKTLTQFLRFLSIFAEADKQIIKEILKDNDPVVGISPTVKFKPIAVPSMIKNRLENAIQMFKSKVTGTVDALASLISSERKSYRRFAHRRISFVEKLRELEETLQCNSYGSAEAESWFAIGEALRNSTASVTTLDAFIKDHTGRLTSNEMKVIERIAIHKKLIEFDCRLYNRMNGDAKLERLAEALECVEKEIRELQNTANELITLTLPILDSVCANTGSYELDEISSIRTTMVNFLRRVGVYWRRMMEQFEMDEEIRSVSVILDTIVNQLNDICERNAIAENQTRFLKYSQVFGDRQGNDELEKSIRKDSLLMEYSRIADSFKRSTIPFSVLIPNSIPAPSLLDSADSTIDVLRNKFDNNVKTLQNAFTTLLNDPPAEYASEAYFNATSVQGPLFEWKNKAYTKNIAKLLQGWPVVLAASVDANDDRQFLRFDSIRLRFQALDETTQQSLNDALGNFIVRMVHPGTSYYSFCDRIHSLNGAGIWDQQYQGEDEIRNEPVRTPYTTWTFSLIPANENVTFSALLPFLNQPIDLQLEGHAKYLTIRNKSAICEKYDTETATPDYTEFITQQSVPSVRKRRHVDTSKWWNPFAYLTGSQTAGSDMVQSLEHDHQSTPSSTSSFSLNGALPLVDFIVRNFTKQKPYRSYVGDETFKSDQLRAQVLRIVDQFEALCAKVSNQYHLTDDQLSPDPILLMSQLEIPFLRGDRAALTEILLESVHYDSSIEQAFADQLDEMLRGLEVDPVTEHGVSLADDQHRWHGGQSYLDGSINLNENSAFLPLDGNFNATLLN